MKQINVKTKCKKMLADLYTPVSIYLRIRDKYPGSVLLESADHNAAENSLSIIGIHPIAGMEINRDRLEYKYPGQREISEDLQETENAAKKLMDFIRSFNGTGDGPTEIAQSFFGYTAYDAIRFFKTRNLKNNDNPEIPLLRYRLYQYVIIINHFKEELYLCENQIDGIKSEFEEVETLIRIKDAPSYPFKAANNEKSNLTDEEYKNRVQKGIDLCKSGELKQVVFARSFEQDFTGDEFNVYRTLRSINPSPYLFFFDYGDYKLMGSSPESQLVIKGNTAEINPIAGTVKRTGDHETDQQSIEHLLRDPKENTEHDMLVDLTRKEMMQFADDVRVTALRKVHSYSHVIHLVSKLAGTLPEHANPFKMLGTTFPAGTLSGMPKEKAIELIDQTEPTPRGFYGGCIGSVGLNGDFNHAIMIRTFLSKGNKLRYQAGAGVVSLSKPESELQEVNNKLNALKQAVKMANHL